MSTYEWETLWVHGAGLDKKLVSPAIEGVETLGIVHVVHEHAAIGATVKGNAQRLKALLAGRVPKLGSVSLLSTGTASAYAPAW